jgi:hypothetical protein
MIQLSIFEKTKVEEAIRVGDNMWSVLLQAE